jgi:hypothetical protein
LAISAAMVSRNVPPNAPMAVLHADAITTSFILNPFRVIRSYLKKVF